MWQVILYTLIWVFVRLCILTSSNATTGKDITLNYAPLQGERKVPAEVFLCLLCHVFVEIREVFGYNL